ncbi:hypothetical protein HZA96_06530 [Candidatus Woesearchaeota archaeon]|nr:hypothetical protein [Candidatus Woesearchaeota archaeon]
MVHNIVELLETEQELALSLVSAGLKPATIIHFDMNSRILSQYKHTIHYFGDSVPCSLNLFEHSLITAVRAFLDSQKSIVFSEKMQERTNESYEYGILKEKNSYLEPHFLIARDKNALAVLQSAKNRY